MSERLRLPIVKQLSRKLSACCLGEADGWDTVKAERILTAELARLRQVEAKAKELVGLAVQWGIRADMTQWPAIEVGQAIGNDARELLQLLEGNNGTTNR